MTLFIPRLIFELGFLLLAGVVLYKAWLELSARIK